MEKCKHCDKLKGKHQANTYNCPMPGRGNFRPFHPTQKFEAKPSRGKKKEIFTL